MPKLSVNICGVELKNPVIAASGTFGFGEEYLDFFDISTLGGISLKAVTVEKRDGNPPPRIAETPSGMLNSIGLQNPGLSGFIKSEVPFIETINTTLIANIAGKTPEDYCRVAEEMSKLDCIDIIELNVSCPNVKEGCLAFGSNPNGCFDITKQVKPYCTKPLMVKLSPNTSDIASVAMAAEEAGADAVSLINTLTGMVIDVHTRKPVLGNITGGLSGPAVMPVALHMVHSVYKAVNIPVVGMGGIITGEDAVAFMLCGAAAVQVGTAGLASYTAWNDVISGIEDYIKLHGINDINEIVGKIEY